MPGTVRYRRSAALRLEPDPRAPDRAGWPAWAAAEERPLAVDLFAGGGGLSLGLEDAGFRVAVAVDHDPWAVETHAANFRGLSLCADLSDPAQEADLIDLLRQADISLIGGGPPCQPFSRAGRSGIRWLVRQGRRPAEDDRRELWRVWLRVVLAVRPRAVLLENVPDMALGDDLAVVRLIVDQLQHAGYETSLDLVDAPDYGVPQHRQRLILVGVRDEVTPFRWPAPVDRVSIWDAIGDLPPLGEGTGAEVLPHRRALRTIFQGRARADVCTRDRRLVFDHVARAVRDDDREAFRLMKPDTRYSDLPDHLRRYRADTFDDKYKRHGRNELARSITAHIAKDGYWYIHPTEDRTFTVREAARLQTFPDRYRFAGNRTHAYRQIGNAVPPMLAERIGGALLRTIGRGSAVTTRQESVPHHPTAALRLVRDRLDAWAQGDALGAPWRHPGDAWPALLYSVLLNIRTDEGTVGQLLWQHPTPEHLDEETVDGLSVPPGVRRALHRLLPAVEAWRKAQAAGDDERTWWDAVRLLPAEEDRFALLALDAPVLLTVTAPLRLAARVTGRPVDKVDRLTDGRLALAELVGGGERAPARMAALAAVGRTVCTIEEPDCDACPFVLVCRSSGT